MKKVGYPSKNGRIWGYTAAIIFLFYFSSSHAANIEINCRKLSISGEGEYVEHLVREIILPLRINQMNQKSLMNGQISKKSIKPASGLLLYGPPGTGKTEVAKVLHELIPDSVRIFFNSPELLSKGEAYASTRIKDSFDDAKNNPSKFYFIVFDEIDTLAKMRREKDVNRCPLEQLLVSMDGNEQLTNVLVVGITNRPEDLDKALIRPGRLEIHVEIPLPHEADRVLFLEYFLGVLRKGGADISNDIDLKSFAHYLDGYSPVSIRLITEKAERLAFFNIFKKNENNGYILADDSAPLITGALLQKAYDEMEKSRQDFRNRRED